MTRRLTMTLLPWLLLVLWACPQPASVQADEPGGWNQAPPVDNGHGQTSDATGRQREGGTHVRRLMRIIQPTEEQKPKLHQILQTHKQALENWREQHEGEMRAIREKIAQARKNNDTEALQAAREEFKPLHDSRAELHKSLDAQLAEVLTDEQMNRARQYFKSQHPRPGRRQGEGPARGVLDKLNLNEEQKTKVQAILKDAHEQAKKTDSPEVRRQLMQDAFMKIEGSVLTPEQIEAFKNLRAQAMARHGGQRGQRRGRKAGLDLTDEQQAQSKAIMDEARAKAQQAETKEEKRAIYREAMAKVHQDVLTDDQREQVKQRFKKHIARRHKKIADHLGLSEDQQARIKEILSSARKQAQGVEDRQQRREIMKQARKKVHDEVLSDEQREKIKAHRRGRRDAPRNDTQEQNG